MAYVELNPITGEFDAVVGDQIVSDISDFDELQEIVEEETSLPVEEVIPDVVETETDLLYNLQSPALEIEEEDQTGEEYDPADYSVMPLSVVDTDYSFSPQTWQLNMAANRSFGEHYLMYGVRRSGSSGYNNYWDYYLVLGNDIEYDQSSDRYSYTDCDLYHYSSYDGYVTYELTESSGSLSGSSSVVYSDLYFDYVGVDPVVNSYPYIGFVMILILMLISFFGGRRNV